MNEPTAMWLNPQKPSDRDCPIRDVTGRALAAGLNLKIVNTIPDLSAVLKDAEIFVGTELDGELVDQAPHLQWIHVPAAGLDKIMSTQVRRSQVVVTNCGDSIATEVAEHALALILCLTRGIDISLRGHCRQEWLDVRAIRAPRTLAGLKTLIVGYGRIGQAIGKHLKMLGALVTGVGRGAHEAPDGTRIAALQDLEVELPTADIVVLTLPATPETANLFDSTKFLRMKQGSILINVGRGSLVDEVALAHHLQQGPLEAAASDVYRAIPSDATDSLWHAKNFFLTPHIGSASQHRWTKLLDHFFGNLDRYREGLPLRDMVQCD